MKGKNHGNSGRGAPPVVKRKSQKAETPQGPDGDFIGNTPENGTSRRRRVVRPPKSLPKSPPKSGEAQVRAGEGEVSTKEQKGEPRAAGVETPAQAPVLDTPSDDPMERAAQGMKAREKKGKSQGRGQAFLQKPTPEEEQELTEYSQEFIGTGETRGAAKKGEAPKGREEEVVTVEEETSPDIGYKEEGTVGSGTEGLQGEPSVEAEEPHKISVHRSLLDRFLDLTDPTCSTTRDSSQVKTPPDVALQDIGVSAPCPSGAPVPDLHDLQPDLPSSVASELAPTSSGSNLSSKNCSNMSDIDVVRDGSPDQHGGQGSQGGLLVGPGQTGAPRDPEKVNITDIIGRCGDMTPLSGGGQGDPLPEILEPGVFGGGVKRTCDRCPLKGKCPERQKGGDCKFQPLLDRHMITNHLDALAAMAGLATTDLARIEEALLREAITGVAEERTDILVGEVHKRLKDLAKLLDPNSGEVKRKMTLKDGTGAVAVLIEKAKTGRLPSMTVLPPMSQEEASQRLHEDSYRSHLTTSPEKTSGGLESGVSPEEHSSLDSDDLTEEELGEGLTDLKTGGPIQKEESVEETDLDSFWE